jgi:membrane-bound lytic murein transglycosylase B
MGKSCLLLALVLLLLAAPALAAPCGGDFNAFLAAIARDAQGQGVSRAVIDQAFAGLTPDPAVLAFDRQVWDPTVFIAIDARTSRHITARAISSTRL